MKLTTLVAAAIALIPRASYPAQFRTGQMVMGTVFQVTVIAEDLNSARQAAVAAVAEARRWDDILTTWRPEGELAQLNRAAGGQEVPISQELRAALDRMVALSTDTQGAFDPGVGPAVDGWRAGRKLAEVLRPIRASLHLGSSSARLDKDAGLDAGAVGKGMALDAVARLLRRRGVTAALLDFGGSSQLAIGAPPDSPEGWTLAVTGLDPGVLNGTIALRDCSLSTSRARPPSVHAAVIVDPRNGKPVTTPRMVTVRHSRATDADAWSTALVVLGRDGASSAAVSGVDFLLEDRNGILKTEGFQLDGF